MGQEIGNRMRVAAGCLALLAGAGEAMAVLDDRVELFAAETLAVDSNVFRLSRDSAASRLLNNGGRGDAYSTTAFGVKADVPISRQRFLASASLNQTHFQRYGELDHTGRDLRGTWLWQLGDSLNGQAGYSETEALASFANIQGRISNPLTTRRLFANATQALTPSWQLQFGVAEQTQRNGALSRRDNDIDLHSADLAFSHLSPAGNRIGLGLREDVGDYPHRQTVGAGSYDNAWQQHRAGLFADWSLSGKSRVNLRVDRIHRDYEQLAQRNYDGTMFRASYDWQATGRFSLLASIQRDISASEDIQTSFVRVRGVALKPMFDISDKLKLAGVADYSTRDYLGDPAVALGTAPARSDQVRSLAATLSYRPLRTLDVQLLGQREWRTSNIALTDYSANLFSLTARLAF